MLFVLGMLWGYYNEHLGVVGEACRYISSIDPVHVV
jgi:hypothetical protein